MKHSCGNEMISIGHWPNPSSTGLVDKYHCKQCNEYISIDVPDTKLELVEDSGNKKTHQQVPS